MGAILWCCGISYVIGSCSASLRVIPGFGEYILRTVSHFPAFKALSLPSSPSAAKACTLPVYICPQQGEVSRLRSICLDFCCFWAPSLDDNLAVKHKRSIRLRRTCVDCDAEYFQSSYKRRFPALRAASAANHNKPLW